MGLKLLSNGGASDQTADSHLFFVFVDWVGLNGGLLRVDDDAVVAELQNFGATLTRPGVFDDVASFNRPDLPD